MQKYKKVKKTFKKAKMQKSENAKKAFKKQKTLLKKKKRLFKKQNSFKICYGWSEQKTFEAQLRPVSIKNFWSQICAGTHIQVSPLYSSKIL